MRRKSRARDTSPATDEYEYTPLGSVTGSFRLLCIEPASDVNSPIRSTLFHTTPTTAPAYVALSYAWGDPVASVSIKIGNEAVSVTPNLRYALRRLRRRPREEEEKLIVWVDAICIKQGDIQERNTQIANMRSIYQNAQSVAVWIGRASTSGPKDVVGSTDALQLARDLNRYASSEKIEKLLTDPKMEGHLRALVFLFRRQYWWRIWVIQEVSCARKAMIYCGDETIPWQDLERVCDIMKEHEEALRRVFYKSHTYIRTLTFGGPRGLQVSRFSQAQETPPLLELLLSHKSKKSSDPRDKVYALVGISSSRHTFGEMNYSHSLKSIFAHTARHLISTTGKLDVICVKQHDIPHFGLPSWVPNWIRPPSSAGATVIGLHHREPAFTAAGDTLCDAEFLVDGYVLKTSGIVIDSIKDAGLPFTRKSSLEDSTPSLKTFHSWWELFTFSHPTTTTSQAKFARAISCGKWIFENEDEFAAKFEAISKLADETLSYADILTTKPPSRTSTVSRSSTSSSMDSLASVEQYDDAGGLDEKAQTTAILTASLMMNRRRMIVSHGNIVGLAPCTAEKGDLICVLLGCRFPVILKEVDGQYVLIGESYVDGFMEGEGIAGLDAGDYQLDRFEII